VKSKIANILLLLKLHPCLKWNILFAFILFPSLTAVHFSAQRAEIRQGAVSKVLFSRKNKCLSLRGVKNERRS
jgi:hypothetical protein